MKKRKSLSVVFMILKGKIALVTFRFLWNCEFILSFCAVLPFASLRMKSTSVFWRNLSQLYRLLEGRGLP